MKLQTGLCGGPWKRSMFSSGEQRADDDDGRTNMLNATLKYPFFLIKSKQKTKEKENKQKF